MILERDKFSDLMDKWLTSEPLFLAAEESSYQCIVDSIPLDLVSLFDQPTGSLAHTFYSDLFWRSIPDLVGVINNKNESFKVDLQLLAQTAIEQLSLDCPGWNTIAMLFLRAYIGLEIMDAGTGVLYGKDASYKGFNNYILSGVKNGYLVSSLKHNFNLEYLEDQIKPERDFLFNYVGLKTLMDKYLLKRADKKILEGPQHMFMAIAMFLAQNEEKGARDFKAKKFYDVLSQMKAMLATPILANARTPRFQLNSCYVGSTSDSINSLFDSFKSMALISKNGGGIGWDFSRVRGIGSSIDGIKNVGGGLIPWLKITNDIAVAVDQLGTRKGAIAAWCEIWHLDIEDFIELRKNSGDERRRAHDLFPALWVCDNFMKRVIDDGDWYLLDPYEYPELTDKYGDDFDALYNQIERDIIQQNVGEKRYKVVKAKDLWKKILTQLFETGLPFIGFKDTANVQHMLHGLGTIRSSNLCTEIFQITNPSSELIELGGYYLYDDPAQKETLVFKENDKVCTLHESKIAKRVNVTDIINVGNRSFKVTKVGKTSENERVAVCTLGSINLARTNEEKDILDVSAALVRMLDNVIDLNCYPIDSAANNQLSFRAIGVGIMGEAELIANKKIKYGSPEHMEYIDEILSVINYGVTTASADLAVERGPFFTDGVSWANSRGHRWVEGMLPADFRPICYKTSELERSPRDYHKTSLKFGYNWKALRNQIKKHGIRNAYLMAIAPTSSISIVCGTTQSIEPLYAKFWYEENISGLIPVIAPNYSKENKDYYVTAYDIEPEILVKLAAVRQNWIDQGQSLNLFIPPEISGKRLSDIYMMAWAKGLKSVYYCRTKSKEIEEQVPTVCDISCESCQ